jgi:hypothetical protein
MERVDLQFFKDWFKEYISQYLELPGDRVKPIRLKEQHTERTCKETVFIGGESGLNQKDLLLAETIALFHDIGRFPQWERYSTFVDSASADHAVLGTEILTQEQILLPLSGEEQEIIQNAVRHHNIRELPVDLPPRQLLFSRLLRDADKLDIWRLVISELEGHGNLVESLAGEIPMSRTYTREIAASLMEGKVPDFSSVRNRYDMILLRLGWIFDVNFPVTCKQVLDRGYVEKLCNNLPSNGEIRNLKGYLISYLENHTGEQT